MDARIPTTIAAAGAAVALAAAAPAWAQEPAPDVEKLAVTPRAFKALPTGPPVVTRGGALVGFHLGNGSIVELRVSKAVAGHRAAGRCVAGKPKKKRGRPTPKPCTIVTPLPGKITLVGITGDNDFRFSGRIDNVTLKPGTYRLTAKATQGIAARSSNVAFTILK